ncbi:MAG: TetR/AcrR family transcriptional regulator [Anaerolineales bacterium]
MLLTSETNKLDPRVRRTRQLLLRALQDLMAEKPFQSITVGDIAERATVNRATFYAHFDDKYALLEFSVREMFRERLRRELPEIHPFGPRGLETLIQAVCDFVAEMGGHCPPPHGQYEPLMEKQIKAEVSEILRLWLAERKPRRTLRGASPDLAAVVASWAIYGAAVQWSQRERRGPSADFARQVLPLVMANLGLDIVRTAK